MCIALRLLQPYFRFTSEAPLRPSYTTICAHVIGPLDEVPQRRAPRSSVRLADREVGIPTQPPRSITDIEGPFGIGYHIGNCFDVSAAGPRRHQLTRY